MNTKNAVRAFAALLMTLAAGACSDAPTDTNTTPALLVVAHVSRAQMRSGDSLTITTTISNQGKYPIEVAQPFCTPNFEVRNTNSTPEIVGPREYFCTLAASESPVHSPSFVLAQGQTREFKEVWHGENRTGDVQSPGYYTVRAKAQTVLGIVYSEAVRVQILP